MDNVLVTGFLRNVSDGTHGYGLYRFDINNTSLFLDFRDCDYKSIISSYYVSSDMDLKYYPGTGFKVYDIKKGNWVWLENDTTHIWDNGRKSTTTIYTSCFGIPDIPTNFNLTNYLGNPKLTWTANSEYDIDGYEVWRKLDSGSWGLKSTIFHPDTDFIDTGVEILPGRNCYRAYYKINAKDWGNNTSSYTGVKTIRYGGCFGPGPKEFIYIEKPSKESISLSDNFPNPFNASTVIQYHLDRSALVKLAIFNLQGQEVVRLVQEYQNPGEKRIIWDGKNARGVSVPSGIYLYQLDTGHFQQVRKMILMK